MVLDSVPADTHSAGNLQMREWQRRIPQRDRRRRGPRTCWWWIHRWRSQPNHGTKKRSHTITRLMIELPRKSWMFYGMERKAWSIRWRRGWSWGRRWYLEDQEGQKTHTKDSKEDIGLGVRVEALEEGLEGDGLVLLWTGSKRGGTTYVNSLPIHFVAEGENVLNEDDEGGDDV